MDPERLFLDHLHVIDQVVRFVARRHLLTPDEAEELASSVKLKIIENDYDVLRKFQGRSSLRTFLTAVVQRHFLDDRIARWGKWRPCVKARQLGPLGLLLDRYISRDGLTPAEAVERVQVHPEVTVTRSALLQMAEMLPVRRPRRFVSERELEELPSAESASDYDDMDRGRAALVDRALNDAMNMLQPEDRLLLRLRFQQELQVSQIARITGLEQKPLYRRLDSLLKGLRRELESKGLAAGEISRMIGHPAAAFSAFGVEHKENSGTGPSAQGGAPCE